MSKEGTHGLMRAFKCTRQTVWTALTFKSDSPLARKIRYTALKEFGGVANWRTAAMETAFDTAHDMMSQDFGNGVRIEVDLKTGEAMLLVEREEPERPEVRKRVEDCTVAELMRLQGEAAKLSVRRSLSL